MYVRMYICTLIFDACNPTCCCCYISSTLLLHEGYTHTQASCPCLVCTTAPGGEDIYILINRGSSLAKRNTRPTQERTTLLHTNLPPSRCRSRHRRIGWQRKSQSTSFQVAVVCFLSGWPITRPASLRIARPAGFCFEKDPSGRTDWRHANDGLRLNVIYTSFTLILLPLPQH